MRTIALVVSTALLMSTALLTACGVTSQDEPQPLVTSTAPLDATPTLTQRPDPPTSTSTPPTTTATVPATTT
ncbi:hypothetical protein [Saccharothrix deserti]|uniref:hypothetical protein n=1 Tax=Saccharothrix deserti TaxID=2593674 RepID=UPI00131EB149|nr:hypothetical protein [Saccharothrix deserti]